MDISYFTSVVTGIIFGIGAIGLSMIYKYLKFPDFTTIVSLSIGSAIMAVVSPVNILLAIFLSIVAGGVLGFITYLQIRYLEVNEMLAGIITSVGAVSIVYLITDNQAIVTSNGKILYIFDQILSAKFSWWNIIKIGIVGILISFLVSSIFNTRYGLSILGMLGSKNYVKNRHRNKEKATILILLLSNSRFENTK